MYKRPALYQIYTSIAVKSIQHAFLKGVLGTAVLNTSKLRLRQSRLREAIGQSVGYGSRGHRRSAHRINGALLNNLGSELLAKVTANALSLIGCTNTCIRNGAVSN